MLGKLPRFNSECQLVSTHTEQIKLETGTEIVLFVERCSRHSSQQGGYDYLVSGVVDEQSGRRVMFFVNGKATERQCQRLGVAPGGLIGMVVLFRKKMGTRNGSPQPFIDIEWPGPGVAYGVRRIGGVAMPPRTLPNESGHEDYLHHADAPPPSPPPPPQPPPPPPNRAHPAAAQDAGDDPEFERFKAVAALCSRSYEAGLFAARRIAARNADLTFTTEELLKMATTIAISIETKMGGGRR